MRALQGTNGFGGIEKTSMSVSSAHLQPAKSSLLEKFKPVLIVALFCLVFYVVYAYLSRSSKPSEDLLEPATPEGSKTEKGTRWWVYVIGAVVAFFVFKTVFGKHKDGSNGGWDQNKHRPRIPKGIERQKGCPAFADLYEISGEPIFGDNLKSPFSLHRGKVKETGEACLIKQFHFEPSDDAENPAYLREERRFNAVGGHRNIAVKRNIFPTKNCVLFQSEQDSIVFKDIQEGKTLKEYFKGEKSVATHAMLFSQLFGVINDLHKRGMVVGDFCEDTIFVDSQTVLKLTHLGDGVTVMSCFPFIAPELDYLFSTTGKLKLLEKPADIWQACAMIVSLYNDGQLYVYSYEQFEADVLKMEAIVGKEDIDLSPKELELKGSLVGKGGPPLLQELQTCRDTKNVTENCKDTWLMYRFHFDPVPSNFGKTPEIFHPVLRECFKVNPEKRPPAIDLSKKFGELSGKFDVKH